MLVPYILCLAGSRLHNRPLYSFRVVRFPRAMALPSLLVDLVSFALFVLARPRSRAVVCLVAYGLRRLLLAGLLLRGYFAVGCILGCGDWADRLACLMYLSGCLYIIVLIASDIPGSIVFTFLLV